MSVLPQGVCSLDAALRLCSGQASWNPGMRDREGWERSLSPFLGFSVLLNPGFPSVHLDFELVFIGSCARRTLHELRSQAKESPRKARPFAALRMTRLSGYFVSFCIFRIKVALYERIAYEPNGVGRDSTCDSAHF